MINAVEIKELTKIYNKKIKAVKNISLFVKKGEIFGLLGPNGAGKTTTIRIITTFLKPTSGSVNVLGFNSITNSKKIREYIGYSVQDGGLDENATGRENLALIGHYYHMNKSVLKNRIDELLNFFELNNAQNRPVKSYSGGIRKRLEIATSLIHNPKLLILDEPTLGLDIQTRSHIWNYLKTLAEQGITIILTTHYLEEADRLCDSIAIIDNGKIVATGTPEELKKKIGRNTISISIQKNVEDSNQLSDILDRVKELFNDMQSIKSIQQTPNGLNISVNDGATNFPQILSVLSKNEIEIESVLLKKPSLDDVFLMYTGRNMREEKGTETNLFKNLGQRSGSGGH